jgi:Zn-dependent alcohol dehydrogenase
MLGVVFTDDRGAEIREFLDLHAGPGEAVVKIRASGLCGTDLHRYRAAEPTEMITGHEPCGVIAELGPGAPDGLAVGDRVMVHHYRGCGMCEVCAAATPGGARCVAGAARRRAEPPVSDPERQAAGPDAGLSHPQACGPTGECASPTGATPRGLTPRAAAYALAESG